MKSSTSTAAIVSVFNVPRAARRVATFIIVRSSGASRMLRKSQLPSRAYWARTLTPMASTSVLTSRRRSGLSLRRAEPSGPSVESITNFGMPRRLTELRYLVGLGWIRIGVEERGEHLAGDLG